MINWNEHRPEDVLRETMKQVEKLDEQLPCFENTHIKYHIKAALQWEEIRNRKRKEQGVQGTDRSHKF